MQQFPQNKDLVTICIPTYNGSKYIVESLTSAVQQSYTDCEILVVDDCSTDQTLEIVQEFAKQYTNVRIHKNEKNLGLVGNWNQCISLANGNWIKFIFQDDKMEPSCVQKMLEAAQHHQCEFVVCERDFLIHDNASQKQRDFYTSQLKRIRDYFPKGGFIDPKDFSSILSKNLLHNAIGEPCSFLFSKEVISKYGNFCSDISQLCDFEFAARVAVNIGLVYVPESLVEFRVHAESTSESNHQNKKQKLKLLDSYFIAYRYRLHRCFGAFRSLHQESVRYFYQQRVYILFADDWKLGYRLMKPFLVRYPLAVIPILKYMVKSLLKGNSK